MITDMLSTQSKKFCVVDMFVEIGFKLVPQPSQESNLNRLINSQITNFNPTHNAHPVGIEPTPRGLEALVQTITLRILVRCYLWSTHIALCSIIRP